MRNVLKVKELPKFKSSTMREVIRYQQTRVFIAESSNNSPVGAVAAETAAVVAHLATLEAAATARPLK